MRTAMITGAAGGLGQALSSQLLEADWSLLWVGRDAERMPDSAVKNVAKVEADVSIPGGAKNAMDYCIQEFGTPPEGLAFCAGSVFLQPLHAITLEQYRDCMRANLDSAFFTHSAQVKALLRAKQQGAAVLVSTVASRIGIARHEAIAAAKARLDGLMRAAAATYASQGIRINAIAPGTRALGLRSSPGRTLPIFREPAKNDFANRIPALLNLEPR